MDRKDFEGKLQDMIDNTECELQRLQSDDHELCSGPRDVLVNHMLRLNDDIAALRRVLIIHQEEW